MSTANNPESVQLAADLSVIVVNYNTGHLLRDMYEAVLRARGTLRLQTIVVDNASRDDSLTTLQDSTFSDVDTIANRVNVGFGRANNQALSRATGRYILLLNTDAFVSTDTLSKTTEFMDAHPAFGILGVRLEGQDGRPQPSCRNFPTPWNTFLHRSGFRRLVPRARMVDEPIPDDGLPRECDWAPGCYLLIRRAVTDQIGLFDPRFFLYSEEVDLCRRTKAAGWKVGYLPSTKVVHWGGESAKSDGQLTDEGQQLSALQIESELLYFRKHYGLAGLLAFAILAWVTDAVHAFKWLLGRRPWRYLEGACEHARLMTRLLLKTGLGNRPTR